VKSVRGLEGRTVEVTSLTRSRTAVHVSVGMGADRRGTFLSDGALDRLIDALTAVRDARRKGAGK
jgi:hypothetical protein